MIPNISDLITDFVTERGEFDVDISIASDRGIMFATGGQRVNPKLISYGDDYTNVSPEDMITFIDSLIDHTPKGSGAYSKPKRNLEYIIKHKEGLVRAVCMFPLESKNVRVDYQAVVNEEGVPELHVRLTANEKHPPNISGLDVVNLSTFLNENKLNDLSEE
jgi:hypothetical protein